MPNKEELEYKFTGSPGQLLKGKTMKKVYLKDLQPDEVIRRLRAGEVVKDEKIKEIIKMIEGILSFVSPFGNIRLNIILNPLCPDYYFEEPEKLKLEVGKCYRTRDGRKAFVSSYSSSSKYFRGAVIDFLNLSVWTEKGLYLYATESGLDLVSEWSDEDATED